MMRVIKRSPDGVLRVSEPLRWMALPNGFVAMTCQCGRMAVLDHDIAADGAVSPSVECPFEDACGFHEYVRLADWQGGGK